MKISVKLLVITFSVVVTISGVSALIYFSLTKSLLETQYSKSILNSTGDFSSYISILVNEVDGEGSSLAANPAYAGKNLKGLETDFFFHLEKDSLIDYSSFRIKDSVYLNRSSRSIKAFVRQNRNIILRVSQGKGNNLCFFGKVITEKFLNKASDKIRGEIALIIDDKLFEVSHSYKHRNYYDIIWSAAVKLKYKNNFDIQKEYLEDSDFMASIFNSKSTSVAEERTTFLVFNNNVESFQFRSTMKWVIVIIICSGVALALILILLFTTKIRKQISLLNEGAEITAKGDLKHRVKVISKDEIGNYGNTFNKMLDELSVIKESEKEYLEFLTLLNQNPSLKEIAEAVLKKIIKDTGLTFGVVYLVEGKSMSVISAHGIGEDFVQPVQSAGFYSKAIDEKEKIEFIFSENYPEIRTGLAYIKIKYLLIFPIVYNKDVIAIIEAASENIPRIEIKKYLDNIHDQLAIGLINAKSLAQLENYIEELKTLNEEYQKQNIQIKGQNEKLLELHNQLKEKAEELEEKRNQAVELTKVKSQFLANMSHELKTPLISIIGLTDLSIKEHPLDGRMKERLGVVYRNGKKLLNMINNILEFSKFETGNVEVKNEVFLLNDLLSDIKDNIQPIAKEKGLSFKLINLKGDALLSTDKTLLERILLNLLFNAVKFTEKGIVELGVSLTGKSDAEFTVSDTGIGISEENQKIIFDEFKQADEGSTKTYSGAGLGLAISKRYVEMLNGRISVKSKIGAGTKFKAIFPKAVVEIVEPVYSGGIEEEQDEAPPKNINALLISKSDNTKKLIQDYLLNYNILLTHFHNVNEAGSSGFRNYSAVFADAGDGSADLWNAIRSMKKENKNLPVLVMKMVEEEKVGYGLFTDDFIFGYSDASALDCIFSLSGRKRKIKNICIVHAGEKCRRDISGAKGSVVACKYKGWEQFNEHLLKNKTDAVIIEMLEPEQNSIELIYCLRKIKRINNLYIALNLPENTNKEEALLLYNEMYAVTLKAKYHPMDVLKVVRDKLGLIEESEKQDFEDEEAAPVLQAVPFALPERRILIVDDDNDTLFTIGEIINGMGCGAEFAHNGVECLSVIAKKRPDLILLDIMMPQMDGFETIKRIRSDSSLKDLPVAALTAYEMLDNREVIERNGFNDLITKPIDSKALAFKIEKLLAVKNEKNSDN